MFSSFSFLIFNLYLTSVIEISFAQEWLITCLPNGKNIFFHDTASCPSGIYLKNPISNFCACGNGVWQFKTEYCSRNIFIDAVNGDCYRIQEKIRWIRYLGLSKNPDAEFTFVTNSLFDSIVSFNTSSPPTKTGFSRVGALNQKNSLSECNHGKCFVVEKKTKKLGSTNMPRFHYDWLDNDVSIKLANSCPDRHTDALSYWVPHRGMYNGHIEGSGNIDSQFRSFDCLRTCSGGMKKLTVSRESLKNSKNGIVLIDNTLTTATSPSNSNSSSIPLNNNTNNNIVTTTTTTTTSTTTTTAVPPIKVYGSEESNSLNEELRFKKSISCQVDEIGNDQNKTIEVEKNVAEQTLRLFNTYYSTLLSSGLKKTPSIPLKEYEYFQIGRLIFEKTCTPITELKILKNLMRMFRIVLDESFSSYPYESLGDEEEDGRIKKSLEECMTDSNRVNFSFSYQMDNCEKQLSDVSLTWDGNGTRLLNSTLPCELSFNTTKYDYVVETGWKVLLFLHYFCGRNFEKNGFDHSRLEFKLRHFFNPEITHRWYHKNEGSKLFETMFPQGKLSDFKSAVDKCVAASRDISPFRLWLKRPLNIPHCGNKNNGEKSQNSENERTEHEHSENRKKRESMTDKTNVKKPAIVPPLKVAQDYLVMNGEGLCMTKYDDGISTGFTRAQDSSCFPKPEPSNCPIQTKQPPPPPLNKNPNFDPILQHQFVTLSLPYEVDKLKRDEFEAFIDSLPENEKIDAYRLLYLSSDLLPASNKPIKALHSARYFFCPKNEYIRGFSEDPFTVLCINLQEELRGEIQMSRRNFTLHAPPKWTENNVVRKLEFMNPKLTDKNTKLRYFPHAKTSPKVCLKGYVTGFKIDKISTSNFMENFVCGGEKAILMCNGDKKLCGVFRNNQDIYAYCCD